MKSFFLPGFVGVGNHLVDGGRAEALARISELLRAGGAAEIGVRDDEVRRLVRLVGGAAELDEVLLVEGEHAVEFERFLLPLLLGKLGELLHRLVAGLDLHVVDQSAAAREHPQRLVQHEEEDAPLGGGGEIPRLVVLLVGPAVAVALRVAAQGLRGEVLLLQRIDDGLGGEHARLDRDVDAGEVLGVAHAGRVPDEHRAVGVELRLGVQAAGGDHLGAVLDQLRALEQVFHPGVGLELLRFEVGVAVRALGVRGASRSRRR